MKRPGMAEVGVKARAAGGAPSQLQQIELVPPTPAHYPTLHRWACDPGSGFRWRFGGGTPSPEQFATALWADVLAQYVVVNRRSAELHGLVVCYGASMSNGHAYFGVQGSPDRGVGLCAMAGLIHLLDHVFTHWPMRKLYAEIPEYNLPSFASSLRRHLAIEGRLVEHTFHAGRYWDVVIAALSRTSWYDGLRPRCARLLDDRNVS